MELLISLCKLETLRGGKDIYQEHKLNTILFVLW